VVDRLEKYSSEQIEAADDRLASFARKFGRPHRYLAYHAAFPVALTPDMLYQIWNNFRLDVRGNLLNIPWVAVADLLLSNLCDEVGHELYQIDGVVRDLLLDELETDPCFGLERVMTLAKFLEDYVAHAMNLGETAPPDERTLAQAQSWTALAYREPGETAVSLTEKLQALDWNDERDLLEIGRISRLLQTFGKPLAEAGQQNLLTYAQVAQEIAAGNLEKAVAIGQSANLGAAVAIAGKQLQLPTAFADRMRQEASLYGSTVPDLDLATEPPVESDSVHLSIGLPTGEEWSKFAPLLVEEWYELRLSIGSGSFMAIDSFGALPSSINIQVVLFLLDEEMQFYETQAAINLTQEMDIRLQKAAPSNPTLSGNSIKFSLHAPKKPGTYRFRCNLYHEQLLLQSRLVELVVSDQPVEQPEPQFRVTLDYDLGQPWNADALSRLGSYKLSLQISDDYRLFLLAENGFKDQIQWREDEWQAWVEMSRQALRNAAWGDDEPYHPGKAYQYERPDLDRLRPDLVRMAIRGSRLFAAVMDSLSQGPEAGFALIDGLLLPGVVQIALPAGVTSQPFTAFYDYPLDGGLTSDSYSLCGTFLDAFKRGQPLAECDCFQGRCPSYNDEKVVCPSGFWGYRHVIGLPLPAGEESVPTTIPMGQQPRLSLHLSTHPDLTPAQQHQFALTSMMNEASGEMETAVTRQESLDLMAQNKAQVVYFYSRAGVVRNRPYLQVGPPEEKGIARSNLHTSRIHWTLPRPLVFLNAINASPAFTPDGSRDLLTGFMETAGAAGLISPEMTVFEQAATIFSEEFLRLFMVERLPAGEAMRLTRLRFLGQGNPLGLVYHLYALPSLMLVYDDRLAAAETAVSAQPQTLLGTLVEVFSFDELALLAYELGIDIDNLPGVDKEAKVEALLAHLDRENGREQLLAAAAEMRTNLDWGQYGTVGTAPAGPFLYRAIDLYFSQGELETLCFDLNIDYESLPGQTKIRKAMELVETCERAGMVAALLRILSQHRPHQDWGPFLDYYELDAEVLRTTEQADGRFLADITIPDDTHLQAGQTFTKTWLVENNGSIPWGEGFQLVHVDGELLAAEKAYALPTAVPGEKVEVSIPMAAPAEPGSYFNDWRFQDDQGNLFGDIVFVRIEVQSSGQETNDRSPTQYSAQIPIHFPLIREIEVTPLIYYRPWSVRTIKLVLTTPEPLPPLRLRPRHINPKEGVFHGFADDSEAFIISWGRGHETGPCIKTGDYLAAFERCVALEPEEVNYLYFNLHHVGPDLPATATLTLEAFDEASGQVVAVLPIRLERAATLPTDIARLQRVEREVWKIQNGRYLPHYESRWWPDENLSYDPVETIPLSLHREKDRLLVTWSGHVVVEVEDQTRPSVLDTDGIHAELFSFDEWHIALRLWFFWFDAHIERSSLWKTHQVPDVKRFDFLLRRSDGQAVLACTDNHFRETWGQVTDTPLRATIGLTRRNMSKMASDTLGSVWAGSEQQEDHKVIYNPIYFIQLLSDHLGRRDNLTHTRS